MCIKCVLQGSYRPSNCYSDWLRLSLHYLHCKLCRFREDHSRHCILSLACRNHTETRMVMPEPYRNTCVSNCKVRKENLVYVCTMHCLFTQNDLGFVYTVNYACLNIKNKVPNSESLKLTLHRKFLMTV